MSLPRWPDAQSVTLDLLEPLVGPAKTVGRIPAEWDGDTLIYVEGLPSTRVDNHVTLVAEMQVSCYGPKRSDAYTLAADVIATVDDLGENPRAVNGVLVDNARVVSGPVSLPDLDPDDQRQDVIVQLSFRRPR